MGANQIGQAVFSLRALLLLLRVATHLPWLPIHCYVVIDAFCKEIIDLLSREYGEEVEQKYF